MKHSDAHTQICVNCNLKFLANAIGFEFDLSDNCKLKVEVWVRTFNKMHGIRAVFRVLGNGIPEF